MKIRAPSVAGSFYPADANELAATVVGLLDSVPNAVLQPKAIRALIVPHAGYIYSGFVAATSYSCLKQLAQGITRVVLLGPSHWVPLSGIALADCNAFQTPIGDIPLDKMLQQKLLNFDGVVVNNEAHIKEHSLEVQLPFLQEVLKDFILVPLVVGQCSPKIVADVLESLWRGDTLIIVSSDLSHYHSYATAQQLDLETSQQIERFDSNIHGRQACGCYALNGLSLLARQKSLDIKRLALANSADSEGDKERVVGYGSYVLQ
mgnify:CR=1 FL=1